MKAGREHRVPLSEPVARAAGRLPRKGSRVIPRVEYGHADVVAPDGARRSDRARVPLAPSRIGAPSRPTRRAKSAKWRWRMSLATRSRRPTGAATCSKSAGISPKRGRDFAVAIRATSCRCIGPRQVAGERRYPSLRAALTAEFPWYLIERELAEGRYPDDDDLAAALLRPEPIPESVRLYLARLLRGELDRRGRPKASEEQTVWKAEYLRRRVEHWETRLSHRSAGA